MTTLWYWDGTDYEMLAPDEAERAMRAIADTRDDRLLGSAAPFDADQMYEDVVTGRRFKFAGFVEGKPWPPQ